MQLNTCREAVEAARDAKEQQAEPPRPFAPSGIRLPENGFSGSGTRRGREPTNAWLSACLVIVALRLRKTRLRILLVVTCAFLCESLPYKEKPAREKCQGRI
jgi:hypothetical protein